MCIRSNCTNMDTKILSSFEHEFQALKRRSSDEESLLHKDKDKGHKEF